MRASSLWKILYPWDLAGNYFFTSSPSTVCVCVMSPSSSSCLEFPLIISTFATDSHDYCGQQGSGLHEISVGRRFTTILSYGHGRGYHHQPRMDSKKEKTSFSINKWKCFGYSATAGCLERDETLEMILIHPFPVDAYLNFSRT